MMADALYIDTSCLLKLLFPEPESGAVALRVGEEDKVVVSSLTQVEAMQQIFARRAAGKITATQHRKVRVAFEALLAEAPFRIERLGGVLWDVSLVQMGLAKESCRTLDRLHLAAMEVLGVRRLYTHDRRQAVAAQELGFEVVMA